MEGIACVYSLQCEQNPKLIFPHLTSCIYFHSLSNVSISERAVLQKPNLPSGEVGRSLLAKLSSDGGRSSLQKALGRGASWIPGRWSQVTQTSRAGKNSCLAYEPAHEVNSRPGQQLSLACFWGCMGVFWDFTTTGCCSVAQLCLTLWDFTDRSTPGFLVLHHLLELAQTHIPWAGDAIQPLWLDDNSNI